MTFDQIQSKLDVLKTNFEQLERIPQASFEAFASDFRNVAATLHLLQTWSCQVRGATAGRASQTSRIQRCRAM
jgi:hypothetical protein